MTKVRHKRAPGDGRSATARDPRWATALVLSALAAATLVTTGSAQDVPVVLGSVLAALGVEAKYP